MVHVCFPALRSALARALVLATTTTLVPVGGCQRLPGAGPVAPDLAQATGQTSCGVKGSAAKPLVVEWPAAERAALEASTREGLVAVRYDGCEMEVLPRCTVPGSYGYTGLNQKREELRIRDSDKLWAELPLGAANLEATLEREGQLNVDMVIVGRMQAAQQTIDPHAMQGTCGEATHVVTGLTLGAFAMYTGAALEGGAGVSVQGIGVGGGASRSRESLRRDGDPEACGMAIASDPSAPEGCGALLRVEVEPLAASQGNAGGWSDPGLARVEDRAALEDARARKWQGVALGTGVGAASLGAGTVAALVAVLVRRSQLSDHESDLEWERDVLEGMNPELVAELETKVVESQAGLRTAAFSSLGLGVSAVVLGGVALAARSVSTKAEQRAQAQRRRVEAQPTAWVGPQGGGVGLTGRF